jgi:hypothetical protein
MNGSEGHLYKKKIKPEVAVYLDEKYPGFFEKVLRLAESLVVFSGETTADGAPDGSTLVCADLADRPDFDGNQVVLLSGDLDSQARDISGATTGGTVIPYPTFGGQIAAGTEFAIVAIRSATDELAALAAKLAGETPTTGSTIADWNTAESDVVAVGAADARYKLHSLILGIHNLAGTIITVRLYTEVNGSERKVYEQTFDATTDPPGLWIVNGTVGIHEVLRVTLESNNAADNGQAVDYDYMLEAM